MKLPPDLAEALARKDELAKLAGLTPELYEILILEQAYERRLDVFKRTAREYPPR